MDQRGEDLEDRLLGFASRVSKVVVTAKANLNSVLIFDESRYPFCQLARSLLDDAGTTTS